MKKTLIVSFLNFFMACFCLGQVLDPESLDKMNFKSSSELMEFVSGLNLKKGYRPEDLNRMINILYEKEDALIQKDKATAAWPSTLAFIEQLRKLAGDDDQKALLDYRKGQILLKESRYEEAEKALTSGVGQAGRQLNRAQIQFARASNLLGECLLLQGSKQQAEAHFLAVMQIPWYLERDTKTLNLLEDEYIRAVRNLITARKGDRKALQEIVMVPAVEELLGPELQKAIKEAP